MPFIDKNDYADVINSNVLDDITEITDSKIDSCEDRAIKLMSGYLSSRFDVVIIFSQTGTNRNPQILGYAKDITLYYLHRLVNWRQIPSARIDAYNQAIKWLEEVRDGLINPPELPVPTGGQKDYILYGSNPKRENHI